MVAAFSLPGSAFFSGIFTLWRRGRRTVGRCAGRRRGHSLKKLTKKDVTPQPRASTFAQVSRRPTVRLNTSPGSRLSRQ